MNANQYLKGLKNAHDNVKHYTNRFDNAKSFIQRLDEHIRNFETPARESNHRRSAFKKSR